MVLMGGAWQKVASAVRAFGLFDGVLYCVDRALESRGGGMRIYSYILVAQPVPEAAPGGSLMAHVSVRKLERGNPVLGEFPLDDEVLDLRFGQGAVCLGVWRKETLLGCFWMHDGTFLEDEVRCRFSPAPAEMTAWDFDVYLKPEHRLGRGFIQLWQGAFGVMRDMGVRWSVSRISGFNERSRASHQALGARRLARALFFKGKRRQLMISSVRPYLHFSRTPETMPELVVRVPPGDAERLA